MTSKKHHEHRQATGAQRSPAQVISGGNKPAAWSRIQMTVAGSGALLIVSILSLAAYSIWDSRNDAFRKSEQASQTLAYVIEAQTRHAFAAVELTLDSVDKVLTLMSKTDSARDGDIRALMRTVAESQPHVRSIFVLDDKGAVIHDSGFLPSALLDLSSRDYFLAHKADIARGIRIGMPRFDRAAGEQFFSVSRRINRPDGGFGGVVVAVIDMDYFQNFYTRLNTVKDGSIALFLRSGTLLFRGPLIPGAVGNSYAGAALFMKLLPAADSGNYRANSVIDKVRRVFAYRAIEGLPLVVAVGISERELLAGWYRDVRTVALPVLFVILTIAGLTGLLVREVGRREALTSSLRESEQRYRYLFEASPHPMWIYDTESLRFLAVNDAAISNYGYSRSEFLEMTALDIRPPQDGPRFRRLASSLRTQANQSAVWRHRRKDGTEFDVEVVSHGFSFDGQPARLVQAQDISARLAAEIRLRESEQHYRSLYENNPHPVWVMDEQTLRIVSANQATVDKYGYTLDELKDMTIADLLPDDDRARVIRQIRARSAADTSYYQRRHVTKDGRVIDAEVTAQPFTFDGRPARMILVDDVTERRSAEQALRDSEQRYRALFDLNPSPMWVYDPAMQSMLAVNEAAVRQYGYTREEFLAMKTIDLYPEEDVPAVLERIRVRDPAARLVRVVRHRKKDGSVIDVEVRSGPLTFNGRAARLAIGNDTTQRRRIEIERARLAAIVDGSSDAIVGRDLDLRIVSWNAAAERLFGYAAEEVLGQSVAILIPHDQEEQAIRIRGLIARGRSVHDLEGVRLTKDGRRIDVSMSQAPILGDHGNLVGSSMIFRDISERKQTAALRAELAAIVENSTEAIISSKLDGTITSWNSGAENMFGFTAAEAIGRPITFMDAGDRPSGLGHNSGRLLRGETIPPYELKRTTKDGRDVEVLTSVSPVRDSAGNITGASVIFHDMSALKQAQNALLRERTLLRTVIDNLPDRIYVKDIERRYLLVNQSDLRHRHFATDETMLGKVAHDVMPHKYAEAFDAEDQVVIDSGKPLIDREIVMESGDGTKTWTLANKIPLRDAAGKIIGLVGIHRDITEARQHAEDIIRLNAELELRVRERTAQLEHTNQELESFAYSVSHDLRAPLRSIDGFSEALIEDCRDRLDATALDYLRRVRAASQRMAELIDDLLSLSRITRAGLQREAIDIGALAAMIVSDLRLEQPQREVEFTVASGIMANADAGLIRLALGNLLGNAWKFTARQSRAMISVGAECNDGRTAYYVRDNGAGFDMRYKDKLFGAFQRLHHESDYSGTGIGLAIVQRIIHRHGGRIWAEAAVNQGATFFFTLE